jgi:hypothetical protein
MAPTAKMIKKMATMRGDARLFELSEPLEGNIHVVVSAIDNEFGTETYIFGCDNEGKITQWGELPGSQKGTITHTEVLNEIGYIVREEPTMQCGACARFGTNSGPVGHSPECKKRD